MYYLATYKSKEFEMTHSFQVEPSTHVSNRLGDLIWRGQGLRSSGAQ